jgi:hypothetical protein
MVRILVERQMLTTENSRYILVNPLASEAGAPVMADARQSQ